MSSAPAPTRTERRAQRRIEERQKQERAQRQRRVVIVAAGAIVLVLAALVAVRLIAQNNAPTAQGGPVPAEVMAQLAGVPASTFDQVGRGSAQSLPSPIRADVQRGPSGLPLITYVGAEYCPFCAGERWPLIVALSRFGTFSNLQLTHSASDDVYPNTPTFSFVGASYASSYVEFSAVELQSNVRSGSTYQALQTPTPAQNQVLQKYDAPPYVPASAAGSIPFLDFANQYLVTGASFDVGLLRGMSQPQIAATLADGSSDQARAIVGSANVLTAAICSATGDQPAEVCGSAAVKSIASALAAAPAPAP